MRAFRFELTKVQVPAIRERVVSQLVNVDADLARQVAEGLGIEVPEAQPAARAAQHEAGGEELAGAVAVRAARRWQHSHATHRDPGRADGVDGASLRDTASCAADEGAVPRFVGPRLGASVRRRQGDDLTCEVTLETAPSVLFDALVIPDGEAGVRALRTSGQALEFVKDQYRHCKTILALGAGAQLLDAARIPAASAKGGDDPGLLRIATAGEAAPKFIAAMARHRHFERQTDPPMV